MRPITSIAVHCSATPAGKAFHVADIDRWHREKGWSGIGYHFVITLDGSVETGRRVEIPGAHVAGHNAKSIGICLIGGMDAQNKQPANTFTPCQFDALATLLKRLRASHPGAAIKGHRDYPKVAKACPSFDVGDWCRSRGIEP